MRRGERRKGGRKEGEKQERGEKESRFQKANTAAMIKFGEQSTGTQARQEIGTENISFVDRYMKSKLVKFDLNGKSCSAVTALAHNVHINIVCS